MRKLLYIYILGSVALLLGGYGSYSLANNQITSTNVKEATVFQCIDQSYGDTVVRSATTDFGLPKDNIVWEVTEEDEDVEELVSRLKCHLNSALQHAIAHADPPVYEEKLPVWLTDGPSVPVSSERLHAFLEVFRI